MTKKKEEKTDREQLDAKTLRQNQKLIEQSYKMKQNRHVKEENEPVFQGFLDSFQEKYGKEVAAKSALEILKLVQSDEF